MLPNLTNAFIEKEPARKISSMFSLRLQPFYYMVHAGVELLKAVPLKNVTKYVMEYFIGINNSLSNKEAHDTLLAPQVQLSKTYKENAKFVHINFAAQQDQAWI